MQRRSLIVGAVVVLLVIALIVLRSAARKPDDFSSFQFWSYDSALGSSPLQNPWEPRSHLALTSKQEDFGSWYPYRYWSWGNSYNPWGGPYAAPLNFSAPLTRYQWQYYPWYTYGSYSPYQDW